MKMGELLGSGRSADVFAIDDHWALRRYRDGGDATAEAAVMTHLFERGYPVPAVREAAHGAAATDLVLRRLRGPTMLQALVQGTITAERAGAILADLLHQLHAIPGPDAADPTVRTLHLDLHPDNVMLTPDGPVVIDWCNTGHGPPALDWAMSSLILAEVAVDAVAEALMARAVLTSLLARLTPEIGLADANLHCLAQAKDKRAADPAMHEHEPRLLDDATELILTLLPDDL